MTAVQARLRRPERSKLQGRTRRLGRDERAHILRVQNLLARAHSKRVSEARDAAV
jgi:hypothetical protein